MLMKDKYRVLTKEEEKEILLNIKNTTGEENKKLKQEFIERNLGLVISVAKHYTVDKELLQDLTQEGCIGVLLAIERFDEEKEFKFSAYAIYWIQKEIISYLKQNESVKIPGHIYPQIKEYKDTKEKLNKTLKREITDTDVAKELGWNISKTNFIGILTKPTSSLDEKIKQDEETKLLDLIADDNLIEDTLMKKYMTEDVRNLLDSDVLTKREKEILLYRYGFYTDNEMTRKKIGEILNVGRETIRRDEVKALKKLMVIAKKEKYDDYLK